MVFVKTIASLRPAHMLVSLLVAVFLLLSGASGWAANISLNDALTQERAWAGLTTKTITVDNITWAYSEGGSVSKPPVLLLHGVTGSRDNWNRIASYLTKDYHVIIPDLPFHGDTQAPADYDPQPAVMVTDLGAFTKALKLKNVNLAGHSLGGSLVSYYAAKYFYNVQSVLLIAPGGVFATGNTPYLTNPDNMSGLLVQKRGDLARIFDIVMQKPPYLPKALIDEQEAVMIANLPQQKKMLDRLIELAKLYKPESFRLVAGAIEAPSFVIWGANDRIMNAEIAKELAGYLETEKGVVVLDNVGHLPIMEAEQLVMLHYAPFLRDAQAWDNPFKGAAPKE